LEVVATQVIHDLGLPSKLNLDMDKFRFDATHSITFLFDETCGEFHAKKGRGGGCGSAAR
jgi:hypothetical protein